MTGRWGDRAVVHCSTGAGCTDVRLPLPAAPSAGWRDEPRRTRGRKPTEPLAALHPRPASYGTSHRARVNASTCAPPDSATTSSTVCARRTTAKRPPGPNPYTPGRTSELYP